MSENGTAAETGQEYWRRIRETQGNMDATFRDMIFDIFAEGKFVKFAKSPSNYDQRYEILSRDTSYLKISTIGPGYKCEYVYPWPQMFELGMYLA